MEQRLTPAESAAPTFLGTDDLKLGWHIFSVLKKGKLEPFGGTFSVS